MEVISRDHFSGQRNVTPTPNPEKRDLADLLIELQQASNRVAGDYAAIDDGDSPYDVTTQRLIGVDTSSAVATVNLPASDSLTPGTIVTVNDEGGNAATNNITIAPDGTDTIDGAASSVAISADNGTVKLYTNGAGAWFTL